MKKLILLMVLFSTAACAEPVAYCYNEGGGKIVLTNEVCRTKEGSTKAGLIAYSTFVSAQAETLTGCWVSDSLSIHILWTGQGLRTYDFNGWQLVKKEPKTPI